ncbi:hypothetical protein A5784_31690 [Mycobacterium sp. 852013-50091_SCH5140682]|nr:hypothetical protein A5784_31690 [Mycobacterium sp. 852013-50091_SCH5140682]
MLATKAGSCAIANPLLNDTHAEALSRTVAMNVNELRAHWALERVSRHLAPPPTGDLTAEQSTSTSSKAIDSAMRAQTFESISP